MLFEPHNGKVKPEWCQHKDLIGKQELTDWFAVQEQGLNEDYEQATGWDGTEEELNIINQERSEFYRWRSEFIRLGFIYK